MRSAQKRARERGRRNEYRTAALLEGQVYTGQAGDVITDDEIIECKYRRDFKLQRLTELADFIEQAKRNEEYWTSKHQPRQWLLQITGGRRSGSYILMPIEYFAKLKTEIAQLRKRIIQLATTLE